MQRSAPIISPAAARHASVVSVADDPTLTLQGDEAPPRGAGAAARPGLLVLFSEGQVAGTGLYAGLPRVSVGRHPDQHVSIDDAGLSRQHAVLVFESAGVRLQDLGSHNGTYLDGVRVTGETAVRMGSVIRCGATLLMPVADIAAFRGWPESARRAPFIGGPEVQSILRALDLLAPRQVEVLVTGESGTGKELLVNLLHQRSGRKGSLVAVNCAAVPEPLFEAELFGVRKGAFTGAATDRPGLIVEAEGGTFFLDEIGEMPLALQPKLLRAVELHQVRAVGGRRTVATDVRFVAATNRDLAERVEQGLFRADLYHRLRGAALRVPPLRDRRHDVVPLTLHLLEEAGRSGEGQVAELTTDSLEELLLHRWPGNVRELRRAVHQALLEAAVEGSSKLKRSHFHAALAGAEVGDEEAARLRQVLERCGGNVAHAAVELGMGRAKLYKRLGALGVSPQSFRGQRRPGRPG